mgnify:CR=1 FL=1
MELFDFLFCLPFPLNQKTENKENQRILHHFTASYLWFPLFSLFSSYSFVSYVSQVSGETRRVSDLRNSSVSVDFLFAVSFE